MDMIKQPTEARLCTGCGMCSAICPKQAIKMRADDAGFLYPTIEAEKCICCGLCEKKCPSNQDMRQAFCTEAYLAKAKRREICVNSSSGGMYTVLSDAVLHTNGVVYAPDFDNHMVLRHMRILSEDKRNHSRGSKYVQSSMVDVYSTLLKDLASRKVIFFGTPCQIAAVKAFVPEKSARNLYLVDVICNGVGSPAVWKLHAERIENKFGHRLDRYIFRPKVDGYLTKAEVACFQDGSVRIIDNNLWKYNPVYYGGNIMRPSCGNCKYASMNRIADVSIGDYSHAATHYPQFDASMGASTLMINTAKGRELLGEIQGDLDMLVLNDLSDHARLTHAGPENNELHQFIDACKNDGLTRVISRRSSTLQKCKIQLAAMLTKLKRYTRSKRV